MNDTLDIHLEPMITLATIEPLYESCRQALESQAHLVVIHAEAVERLCTPLLQLLLSFKKTLDNQGRKMEVRNPSPVFAAMLACTGLESFLICEGEKT